MILLLGYHRGYIALDGNNIENPLFFVLMSMAGWFLLYGVAALLVKAECKMNKILAYISVHAIPIIALHFLCFKIVNALAVVVYGMESYMIAAFPVLMLTGVWWLAYTIIGLICPLLLNYVMKTIGRHGAEVVSILEDARR